MVTNCDERVLLQCCCTPAKCHLDHIAGICNLKIAAVLEERARKGKQSTRARAWIIAGSELRRLDQRRKRRKTRPEQRRAS